MQDADNDIIENENDINLKKIVGNFLRYWYIYLISLTLTLSAAYFYNWYVNPTYRVYAKVLIQGDKGSAGTQELLKDLDVYLLFRLGLITNHFLGWLLMKLDCTIY